MGRFSIACVSGCTCGGVHNISGIHPWHTSVYKFAYFSATQHEQCRLRVSSLRDSKHGGNKVCTTLPLFSPYQAHHAAGCSGGSVTL
jgi:hypothetical protein